MTLQSTANSHGSTLARSRARSTGRSQHPFSSRPIKRVGNRDEAGFSSLEMAILFPLTIFIVFGIIQFGVWDHDYDVARAAAQEAVRSASAYHGSQTDGSRAAALVLEQNAKGLILHTTVSCKRGPTVATASVTGQALEVVPFISLPVKATATAPVEAFLPPPRA